MNYKGAELFAMGARETRFGERFSIALNWSRGVQHVQHRSGESLDDVRRLVWLFVEEHTQVASLLCHPLSVGVAVMPAI
jgi:hypothetical protein